MERPGGFITGSSFQAWNIKLESSSSNTNKHVFCSSRQVAQLFFTIEDDVKFRIWGFVEIVHALLRREVIVDLCLSQGFLLSTKSDGTDFFFFFFKEPLLWLSPAAPWMEESKERARVNRNTILWAKIMFLPLVHPQMTPDAARLLGTGLIWCLTKGLSLSLSVTPHTASGIAVPLLQGCVSVCGEGVERLRTSHF